MFDKWLNLWIVEVSVDARQHREYKGGRFASARLRLSDEVLRRVVEQGGQRGLLDFGRLGEAHRVEALQQLFLKIQLFESLHRVERRVGILALHLDARVVLKQPRTQQLFQKGRV